MWESDADFVTEMLDTGCMTDYFMDTGGEWVCQWDMKKLEELYPDVYNVIREAQLEEVDEALRGMVDKGLLEMSFQETPEGGIEAVYSLTDAGREAAKQIVDSELRDML